MVIGIENKALRTDLSFVKANQGHDSHDLASLEMSPVIFACLCLLLAFAFQ